MSRAAYSTEKFVYAFGVDHAMGAFIQIFLHGQEEPIVDADAVFGVRVHDRLALPLSTFSKLEVLRRGWSKERCNIPEEAVIDIGRSLGVSSSDFERKVYELWD